MGIQRARGHAILCTNADVQLSVDVIRYIAKTPLEDQVLYRAIRLDIDQKSERPPKRCITRWFLQGSTIRTPRYWPYAIQYAYAHLLAALKRLYYKNAPDWYYVPSISRAEKVLFDYPFNASGDFALMTKSSWLKLGGYRESCIISTHVDSMHLVDCLRSDMRVELLTGHMSIIKNMLVVIPLIRQVRKCILCITYYARPLLVILWERLRTRYWRTKMNGACQVNN